MESIANIPLRWKYVVAIFLSVTLNEAHYFILKMTNKKRVIRRRVRSDHGGGKKGVKRDERKEKRKHCNTRRKFMINNKRRIKLFIYLEEKKLHLNNVVVLEKWGFLLYFPCTGCKRLVSRVVSIQL